MGLKDNYLTISEAADFIGVTRQTISRWIRNGEFKVEKIGREVLIEKNEVERYQSERIQSQLRDKVTNKIITAIREEGGYGEGDIIQLIADCYKGKPAPYIVARADGNIDKLRVRINWGEYEKGKVGGGVIKFSLEIIEKQHYVRVNEENGKQRDK